MPDTTKARFKRITALAGEIAFRIICAGVLAFVLAAAPILDDGPDDVTTAQMVADEVSSLEQVATNQAMQLQQVAK